MDVLSPEWRARFEALPPAGQRRVVDRYAEQVQKRRYAMWQPYPWQVCPAEVPAMGAWVLGGGRGVGKRLYLGTMIPTPSGWTTMAQIAVGTELLDDQGNPCTVIWVSPDNYGDSYRVTFSDGSEVLADAEHQWLTWDRAARKAENRRSSPEAILKRHPKVRTTSEIAATLMHGKERNHSVRNTLPLNLPTADLPVAPYTLGLWLGDGRSNAGTVTVGRGDEASLREVEADGYRVRPHRVYQDRAPQYLIAGISPALRAMSLMNNKHVPPAYLRASAGQRLALLQGLMDSDGWMGPSGLAEFVSTTLALADAVHELAVSLGMKVRRSQKRAKLNGVEHRMAYTVRFTPIMPVFRLSRKLAKWIPDAAQASRRVHRYIDKVEKIPSVPMRCIAVDSPSRLYLAGRDMIPTHNTDAGARYVLDHVAGPACDPRLPGGHRVAIIAPTLGDAAESAIMGPSGLKTHDPRIRMVTGHGGTHVIFANGARAKVFGAHTKADIERLRSGGNRCCVWMEEAAAMRYLDDVITHSKMGLRLGPRPHYVITTTPKPREAIIRLWNSPKTLLTKGRTLDAYHLPPEMRQDLLEEYGGTTLGRQELDGEILTDIKGALVSHATMDASRVPEAPELNAIVIGVDPNGTGNGDMFGIVAVGRGAADGHAYVIADASTQETGRAACLKAWALYDELDADFLVVEENFGKAYLRQTLADAWAEEHEGAAPVRYVNVGTGKALRAQPMAMRWEQKRVHIVGVLDKLEDQFATWVPAESTDSPDRVDAAVHGFAFFRSREKAKAKVSLPHTASLR